MKSKSLFLASVACLAVVATGCDNKAPASASEITDPKYVSAVAELIRSNGFECPRITNLNVLGSSPYGPKMEALCGPVGEDIVDVTQNYLVYPDKFMVTVCKPWGMLDNGCG